MVSPMMAAKAYAAAAQNAAPPVPGAPPADGPDFAQILKTAMTDTVGASRHAEAIMGARMQGKAELVDVVTAVASAQTSLQTVMAVRDQVISAYKEILAMPI